MNRVRRFWTSWNNYYQLSDKLADDPWIIGPDIIFIFVYIKINADVTYLSHSPASDAITCQHKIQLAQAFGEKDIVTTHVQSKVVHLFDVCLFVFSVFSR